MQRIFTKINLLINKAKPKTKIGWLVFVFVFLVSSFFVFQPAFAADEILNGIMQAGTWIVMGLATWCIQMSIFLLGFIIEIAGYNGYLDTPAVKVGWVMVRDVTNMFFVIILLIIAFGTILGLEQYEWKKLMVKFVLAAVLVNFSRTICGVFIDAAQVFMITFVNAVAATAGGNLIRMFAMDEVLSFSQGVNPEKFTDANMFIAGAAGLFFAAMMLAVMFGYMVILLARMLVLWVLIILSPLAFVLNVIPQTQSYAQRWWKEFGNHVLVGPVLIFFLWLSFVTAGAGNIHEHIQDETVPSARMNTTGIDPVTNQEVGLNAGLTGILKWSTMANFFIAIGMLMVGVRVTNELGVEGGGALTKSVDFAKKAAMMGTGITAGMWAAKGTAGLAKKGIKGLAYNAPVIGGRHWVQGAKRMRNNLGAWATKEDHATPFGKAIGWFANQEMRGQADLQTSEKLYEERKKGALSAITSGDVGTDVRAQKAKNTVYEELSSARIMKEMRKLFEEKGEDGKTWMERPRQQFRGAQFSSGKDFKETGKGTKVPLLNMLIGWKQDRVKSKLQEWSERTLDSKAGTSIKSGKEAEALAKASFDSKNKDFLTTIAKGEQQKKLGDKQVEQADSKATLDEKLGVAGYRTKDKYGNEKFISTEGDKTQADLAEASAEYAVNVAAQEQAVGAVELGYRQSEGGQKNIDRGLGFKKQTELQTAEWAESGGLRDLEYEKGEESFKDFKMQQAQDLQDAAKRERASDKEREKNKPDPVLKAESEVRAKELEARSVALWAENMEAGDMELALNNEIDRSEAENLRNPDFRSEDQIKQDIADGLDKEATAKSIKDADNRTPEQKEAAEKEARKLENTAHIRELGSVNQKLHLAEAKKGTVEETIASAQASGMSEANTTLLREAQKTDQKALLKLAEMSGIHVKGEKSREALHELEKINNSIKDLNEKKVIKLRNSNNKSKSEGQREKYKNAAEKLGGKIDKEKGKRKLLESSLEEIDNKDDGVRRKKRAIKEEVDEIRSKSITWQKLAAKSKEKESQSLLTTKHEDLLSKVDQEVVWDKRGMAIPTSAITELMEGYEKDFSMMNYEVTVSNMGDAMKSIQDKRKNGENVGESDKAALMGLFKHAFNNSWVDDAIFSIMGDEGLKETFQGTFGWEDMEFTPEKINQIEMMFASGMDDTFGSMHDGVSKMMKKYVKDLNMDSDAFFGSLKDGDNQIFDKEDKKTFNDMKKKITAKTGKDMTNEEIVDYYLKTHEDNAGAFQMLGNLRDAAIAGNHPENAGHAQYMDVGDGKKMYVGVSSEQAADYVNGDINKLNTSKRAAMHTHASANIDESRNVVTDIRESDFAVVRKNINNTNDRRGTNGRFASQMAGISATENASDYRDEDGYFVAMGTSNTTGKQTVQSAAFREKYAKVYGKHKNDKAYQDKLDTEYLVENIYAKYARVNPADFLMNMAEASGIDPLKASQSGEMRMKIGGKPITNISQFIDEYNNGGFSADDTKPKGNRKLPTFSAGK